MFAAPKSPANGTPKAPAASGSVMILDSSDDEPAASADPVYSATFEETEPEFDERNPFPDVLTYVDIQFGTAATALTVCEKVEGKIVFAATCADSTVRLVTLPLTPPGLEQQAAAKEKKKGRTAKWGETIHTLGGFSSAPDLVAITYQKSTTAQAFPTLLIASHSREVTGLLLLHTVPVSAEDGKPTYSVAASHSGPSTSQYLPSPASSLDFSPTSSTLLLGFRSGCVRLYSPTTSSWQLTLHTPLAHPSPSSTHHISNASRKAVLDAKYVLNGKAITVLLSDGEWGVWDLLDASPSGTDSKSILTQGGIRGGAMTPFAIGGFIDGPPAKSSHPKSSTASTQSKFAPMTPATRKTVYVTAGLASQTGVQGGYSTQGSISVVSLHNSATQAHDDQIAFWIGDSYAVIHSLRGFWQGKTRHGGSLFGSKGKCATLERIEGVQLRGEKATGMSQFENEMCVVGEHRMLFVKSNKEVNRGRRVEFDEEEIEGGLEGLDRSLDLMEERRVASSGSNFGQSFGSSGFGHSRNGSGFGDSFRSFDSRA